MRSGYHRAITVESAGNSLNHYVQSLLKMEPRIRVYPLFGDVEEDKGFFVTQQNIFIPFELPRAEHDVAHMLEMRNHNRWTLPDWGMPRFEESLIKPGPFFAALAREVRTRAIQLHISVFKNEQEKMDSTAYDQFNNPYWADMARKLLPYGRFRTYQDVLVWIAGMRETTHKSWSLERVFYEWEIRLNHLRHWMETSAHHKNISHSIPRT